MLRCDESEIATMADPQGVRLDAVAHLMSDHCAWTPPAVMLSPSSTFHAILRSLRLPVVDLRSREIDLVSSKIRPGGDGAVIPLGVIQVDDGFHRLLADLEGSLVASIGSGL